MTRRVRIRSLQDEEFGVGDRGSRDNMTVISYNKTNKMH